jgi:hypothetical protein
MWFPLCISQYEAMKYKFTHLVLHDSYCDFIIVLSYVLIITKIITCSVQSIAPQGLSQYMHTCVTSGQALCTYVMYKTVSKNKVTNIPDTNNAILTLIYTSAMGSRWYTSNLNSYHLHTSNWPTVGPRLVSQCRRDQCQVSVAQMQQLTSRQHLLQIACQTSTS